MDSLDPFEVRKSFTSLESWAAFWAHSPWIANDGHMSEIVAYAKRHGVLSDFLGEVPPNEIFSNDKNYRETFIAREFNPRQRVLLDLIHESVAAIPRHLARVYAHEALTKFALALRGRYARCIGSEYATSKHEETELFPIPSVDIARSPFPDASFDLVVSGDVFEHLPDMAAALADTARILRPGGKLLATFPFASGLQDTYVRAELIDGQIIHYREPEYHGNPASPNDRSLVFQVPGWSILDMGIKAGFSSAEMVFWCSRSRGFIASDIAGILVFRATR